MRYAILLALIGLVSPGLASTPDKADYTSQYSVINTMKVGSVMIGKFCTMGLRDQATPSLAFIVQRRGYGGCHVWDAGTVFQGRREKNSIKLLVTDDKGKLKVEDWPITGTVAVNPPAAR